jgi:hypothetical protein
MDREAIMKKFCLHAAMLLVTLALMFAAAPASAVQKKSPQPCDNSAFPGSSCRASEFCQGPTGQCFIAFLSGTCTTVPQVCLNNVQRVCGCDGKTYSNDCKRRQARVTKVKDGAC